MVFGLKISALFKHSNMNFMTMFYIILIAIVSDDVASVFLLASVEIQLSWFMAQYGLILSDLTLDDKPSVKQTRRCQNNKQ